MLLATVDLDENEESDRLAPEVLQRIGLSDSISSRFGRAVDLI